MSQTTSDVNAAAGLKNLFYELYRTDSLFKSRTEAGGSKWAHDKGENCEIMPKLLHLEEHAVGGYCYLRLLVLLPVFDRIKLDLFKKAVDYLKEDAGMFPIGKDLMVRLAALNILIEQDRLEENDRNVDLEFDPNVFDKMMMNHHWFALEINSDVIHIGSCEWLIDQGPESRGAENISTSMNGALTFSSKYMVVMLGASNKQVGGTVVDLNEIFDEIDMISDYTLTEDELKVNCRTDSVIDGVNEHITRSSAAETVISTNDHEELAKNILDQHEIIHELRKKLELTTDSNRKAKKALSDLIKREQKILLTKTDMGSELEFTPDDSISNFGERRRYMRQPSTIITTRPRQSHQLETLVEVPMLRPTKEVVVGYQKTISMQERETESLSKVQPINGLANPFRNNRLNLLLHFHTAVETNLPINDDNGYRQSLISIIRYKAKSPSEELSKQIVMRTFDFDNQCVIANPFNLPFIEVGMLISDNCLAGCFSLLKIEFKTLWFNSMKSLYVPRFHKDFRSYSETSTSNPSSGRPSKSRQPSVFSKRG